MKIALGTAQFGSDYGISNVNGKVGVKDAITILEYASNNGIKVIDTACTYGNSEEILGNAMCSNEFDIVTKTPVFSENLLSRKDEVKLIDTFQKSLKKLKKKSIYGVLIHHVNDIFKSGGNYLIDALTHLKNEGFVKKIGVSIYTTEEVDRVLEMFLPDIIQLPINVFDQRLIHGGYVEKIKKKGIEIHARSIFLQGLLLMDYNKLDPFFDDFKKHLNQYSIFLSENSLSKIQAALMFANGQKNIDKIIIGITSINELREIIDAVTYSLKMKNDWSSFAYDNPKYLNPALWELNK